MFLFRGKSAFKSSWHRMKNFSTTKTKLLWFARIALGKYFNLIIRQHTKTCYLMKSLWVINFSLVLRSQFYIFFPPKWIERVCLCVCVSSLDVVLSLFSIAFLADFLIATIHIIKVFRSAFRVYYQQIYGLQCFNVLMTLTTFKLWICCICIYEQMGSEKATAMR